MVVVVVAAILVAGSERRPPPTVKHHVTNARTKVGAETTAQLVWILAPRLPEPEGVADSDETRPAWRGWPGRPPH